MVLFPHSYSVNVNVDAVTFSKFLLILCLCGFLLPLTSCNSGGSSSSPLSGIEPYAYSEPTQTGDGWQTANLSDAGIDDVLLVDLINNIRKKKMGFHLIDSLLIIKDGFLVFDETTRDEFNYYDGLVNNNDLTIHSLHSVTKSWVSTAIGIAIDQGFISDVDVLVHDYYLDRMPIQNFTAEKQSITLENWLTMRAGYQWNENSISLSDRNNVVYPFNESNDPVQFLLDRPMADIPGTTFNYNSGVAHVLGDLVQRTTGMTVQQYMDINIFQPLGIVDYHYFSLNGQFATGGAYGGLFISSRDMAKLGQLFLDKGLWNGQRIVSEQWVNQATTPYMLNSTLSGGYGYQWWYTEIFSHNGQTLHCYYANGYGQQFIFVMPELNMVVVMTGHAYSDADIELSQDVHVILDYVLPSIN